MAMQEQNIIPMLELSVRNQQETSNTLTMMLEAVKRMAATAEMASATAQEAKAEAQAAATEIREIADEVRNSVWLFPAESNTLHDAVRERSIELAKYNQVSDERFTETVGKIRRRIWSNLKKQFGVAKYIYIPHKSFDEAMRFVQEFSLAD
ncbi:hypothetical protein AAC03nite_20640 [Alicyclobacillus acidoterrestris]|nr:hypothetical protein AAC03nite_20640 [Alicyclobacillus acidoterrestris]